MKNDDNKKINCVHILILKDHLEKEKKKMTNKFKTLNQIKGSLQ